MIIIQGENFQEFSLKIIQCKQIQIIRDTVRPGLIFRKVENKNPEHSFIKK